MCWWLAAFSLLGSLLFSTNYAWAADSEQLEACAARVAEQILLVPADIAARPSKLRELLAAVDADTQILEAEAADQKELVSRAKAWMDGLSAYLADKADGTDNPLPGFPVVGLTPYVAAISSPSGGRFEDLLARITRVPETVSNDSLQALIDETRSDIRILETRRSPEDVVLCRRARRWLQALLNIQAAGGNPPDAAEDIGFVLDGSALDGGDVLDGTRDGYSPVTPEDPKIPKSPLEKFLELARESVLEDIMILVVRDEALKEKLRLGPAKNLGIRDQLLLLSDDPKLLAILDEFSVQALGRRVQLDPFGFGARLDDYKIYVAEADFFLARILNGRRLSPEEQALASIGRQWIDVANSRIEKEDDGDPKKQLDGPSLIGLGRFGGFRLASRPVPRFVPAMADIETFLTPETAKIGIDEAFDPKLDRLPPVTAHFIEMVRGAQLFSRIYERNLRLAQGSRPEATFRDQVVALAKDEDLRRLLAEIAQEEFETRSAAEKKKAAEGPRKVDVFVIGAGLHDQHVQNAFTQLAPGLDSLSWEAADNVASTFDQGGYAVSLNSTLRAADPTNLRQMLTSDTMEGGDLNYLLGGVVQLNQFESRQNPVLKSMAQGIQINRYFSKGASDWRRV
ncbi:MAG: hypothetical protein R3B54_11460 [Bdellovibrionota bacterium]